MSYCIFFNLLWHCKTKASFRFTENVHQSAYHCKRLGINPSIANIAFETCTEWICFPIMGRFVVFRFVSQISCREILQCRHKMGPGCMDKLISWSSRCCATNTIHPTILAELRWDLWALISSQLISGVFIFAAHWLMTTLDRETKMNSNMTFLTGVTSSEIRYKSDPGLLYRLVLQLCRSFLTTQERRRRAGLSVVCATLQLTWMLLERTQGGTRANGGLYRLGRCVCSSCCSPVTVSE